MPSGPFVGDDHQGHLFALLPPGRQPHRPLVGFPQPHLPLPVLSWLTEQVLERLPEQLSALIALGGILAFVQFEAQQVVPVVLLT